MDGFAFTADYDKESIRKAEAFVSDCNNLVKEENL